MPLKSLMHIIRKGGTKEEVLQSLKNLFSDSMTGSFSVKYEKHMEVNSIILLAEELFLILNCRDSFMPLEFLCTRVTD